MTTLELTQDRFAIVDEDLYQELSKHKWYYDAHNKCASRRDIKTKKIVKLHRVITNPTKGFEVDHINGNGLDNRRENLRIVTHHQNCMNTKRQRNNTSGFKGITWDKQMKKWRARISVNRKPVLLGLFKNKFEAALVYEQAATRYFGEFKRRVSL